MGGTATGGNGGTGTGAGSVGGNGTDGNIIAGLDSAWDERRLAVCE